MHRFFSRACYLTLFLVLSACSSAPKNNSSPSPVSPTVATNTPKSATVASAAPHLPKANSGRGGYYLDDGPGEDIPPDLESTVDPIPVVENYSRTGNKPYVVFGKTYTPIIDSTTPFKQRGVASWYGKKFHGKRTSSGEPYNMYKITAAHPLLPIPSYARVTNLTNGKQIIVRINDRGPFHSNRIMDLSYTAALKLGYLGKGSSEVELERLLPEDIAKMEENRNNQGNEQAVAVTSAVTSVVTMISSDSAPQALAKTPANEQKVSASPTSDNNSGTYYLQLAAFAIRANAEASLQQLQRRLRDVKTDLQFHIAQQGNLYRLQSGPYASRDEATALLEQLASSGEKPMVLRR